MDSMGELPEDSAVNPVLNQHPATDPGIILQLRDRQYAAEYAGVFGGLGFDPGGYHETIAKRGSMTAVKL